MDKVVYDPNNGDNQCSPKCCCNLSQGIKASYCIGNDFVGQKRKCLCLKWDQHSY